MLESKANLVQLHTISTKIHAQRKYFFKQLIPIARSSSAPQTFHLLQTRCPIVTWRKLKFISVVATALALIATLAVARAVRSSAAFETNRAQAAPLHLQNNFACPPLISSWDCEIVVNTFPMSTGDRRVPLMRMTI